MADAFQLEILTPEKTYFTGDVDLMTITTAKGEITLLPNHVDYIADIVISKLYLEIRKQRFVYAISGGALTFDQKKNAAKLFVYAIESKDEIDLERALKAKENADSLLQSAASLRDSKRAEVKLKRALNRIDVKRG